MISIFAVDIQARHHALWSCCDKPNVAFELFCSLHFRCKHRVYETLGAGTQFVCVLFQGFWGLERPCEIVEE